MHLIQKQAEILLNNYVPIFDAINFIIDYGDVLVEYKIVLN